MNVTDEMIEAAARAMCEAWHYSKIGTPDGDAEWRKKQGQYRMQARAAITAALSHADHGGVKVLEWQEAPVPPSGESLAPSVVGLYCIPHGTGIHRLRFRDSVTLGEYSTIEAAKAAAFADYERRILYALTQAPAPTLTGEVETPAPVTNVEPVATFATCFNAGPEIAKELMAQAIFDVMSVSDGVELAVAERYAEAAFGALPFNARAIR